MEQKEYPVEDFQAGSGILEFLDAQGQPLKPKSALKYQIVAEDRSVLREGTLDEDNYTVSLERIPTSQPFRVLLDSHFVVRIEGQAESIEEEQESVEQNEELLIPRSAQDPEYGFQLIDGLDDVYPEDSSSKEDSTLDDDSEEEGTSTDEDSREDQSPQDDEGEERGETDPESVDDESDEDQPRPDADGDNGDKGQEDENSQDDSEDDNEMTEPEVDQDGED